jgi:hypothetical protein
MRNPLSRFSSSANKSTSKKKGNGNGSSAIPPPTVGDIMDDKHIPAAAASSGASGAPPRVPLLRRGSGGDKHGDFDVSDSGPDLEELEGVKINRVMLLKVPNFETIMPERSAQVANRRNKLSGHLGTEVGYDL